MADLETEKKEFLENCRRFKSIFGDNPVSKNVYEALELNKKVFAGLQKIAAEGSEQEKKEAFAAFGEVMKAFGPVYDHIVKPLQNSPTLGKKFDIDALIKSGAINADQWNKMQKLKQDFEKLGRPQKTGDQ